MSFPRGRLTYDTLLQVIPASALRLVRAVRDAGVVGTSPGEWMWQCDVSGSGATNAEAEIRLQVSVGPVQRHLPLDADTARHLLEHFTVSKDAERRRQATRMLRYGSRLHSPGTTPPSSRFPNLTRS